ncbi:MAG TPA: hypothetical protein VMF09_06080 [Solirubrobacteraceae bacterium]|nr:hypothetical protein [Solirubrobacteraceae bacterium]
MGPKLPSSASALLAAGAAIFAISGCGGAAGTATVTVRQPSNRPSSAASAPAGPTHVQPSGDGTNGSSATNTPSTTVAQAVAYAHAVNLQPVDLPDLRVTQPEGPTKPGPHEGAFAQCVGETAPGLEVARIHSAAFQDAEGFEHIRSSVVVQPSEAVALRNYRAALQPRLLTCLQTYLPQTLTRKTTAKLRYGPVSATRLTGLRVPHSIGVQIRTSIIVSTLRKQVPVYVDEYDFIDGAAEINLTTEGAPQPLPAEAQARLLWLLYSRAKHRGSQAPDRSSNTQPGPFAATATRRQRLGTCQVAPPQVNFPAGAWTASETILTTNAIDACAGERLVRPWDFRRRCDAGTCKTFLYTASYYQVVVAEIVRDGRGRYTAIFQPTSVPCPHRPDENAGTDRDYTTMTLWSSPHTQILHALSRDYQVGPCGGGPVETSSYVVTRTNPTARPPAVGP